MESIFKKIMGWRNYLNELTEQNCTQEAFDTHWVAPLGPNASGFEHDLVQYLGNGGSGWCDKFRNSCYKYFMR